METPVRFAETERVNADSYLIRQIVGEGIAPILTPVNTLVITAGEPIIVDTGLARTREGWLERTFAVVDPADVRWIYLSHDDGDHTGNVMQVLEQCPNATLVTNWFSVERMVGDYTLPHHRMRWVNDGESFDAGDREMRAVLPPTFDSPTTRGLFDTKTGLYWAADSFAVPVPFEISTIDELPPGVFRESFSLAQRMVSPWHRFVDPVRYGKHLDRISGLGATVITSSHGPVLRGQEIDEAFDMLRELPDLPPVDWPTQNDLHELVKKLAEMAPAS
ncbi:MAG TPA: MBL fold metallo-hydrolase [Acidimicrobiales bacterium]